MTTPVEAMRQAAGLEAAGRIAEAENIYRRIIESQPSFHPAWHALGLLAYRANKLPPAAELVEKAIVASGGEVGLYFRNLGELYRRLGLLEKAMHAGSRAVELSPGDLDAWYNLGLACTDSKDFTRVIECYRKALEINADHGLSWNNLGSALEQTGDKDEAEKAYAKAVALNPQHAEAQNNLGAIQSERGLLDEARASFQAAIDAKPDFVEAHYNLSSLKSYKRDDPHLAMLESVYEKRASLTEHARIRYGFALGKALDDIGETDRAFAAFEEGNRLQHALLPVDEARADAMLARIIETFDEAFFAARRDWQGMRDDSRAPVFIVGMPRSGTTLLEQILCSHPSVYGAGELTDFNEIVMQATDAGPQRPFVEGVTALTEADMRRIGENYLNRVWQLSPDSAYITDKMPANFFYLGLIHLALPGAKIIHAMRDPMDSCFSCYTRLFNDTMDFAYDQGTLGRYYVRYIKLMEHWRRVLPQGTVLDLPYEDMVADTEGQARRVLEFVGLPWDENCLRFHENKRLVKTASNAQVRKPIYKTSVARWKRYAKHLRPLYEIVKDYRPADDAEELIGVAPERTARLTPEQAAQLAGQLQASGRLQEAETLLRQILQADARNGHALHLLGVVCYQSGRQQEALQLIEQAIGYQPEVALFHSNLAEMYRQQGRVEEAIRHGRRATELSPDMASAYSNLGIAYYDAKDYDRAEACHRKALELEPRQLQSLNNMGSIQRARKNLPGAAEWYRKVLAVNPDYVESLSNLGAVLVEDGYAAQATPFLEKAILLAPDYVEALCNLGLARLKQDRVDEAVALFERSLKLRPDYPEALIGMGRARNEQDRLDEAHQYFNRVVEVAPDKPEAWCQLAALATEMGEPEKAEDAYDRALQIEPEMAEAIAGLGNLRLEAGKLDEAVELLERAIEIKPDSLSARFQFAQARKVKPGDANLAVLEEMQSESDDWEDDRRIAYHYALGKAYDDLKEYDRAFPHFLEGAQLKRARIKYDPDADASISQRIITHFTQTRFRNLRGAGDPSTVPIFVLGMPRSGTTLTEQIIASHPEVYGAGELPDLMDVIQHLAPGQPEVGYPDNIRLLKQADLTRWGEQYVRGLRARAPGARHITDKMPVNYYALGLIPLMLPNAKIVHVRRNPVDTCVSCFTRLFNRHQDATYNLAELGRHYASYARLMEHWRKVMPEGSFLEVQYEDIVADMETQARRLIDWCGLEWDEACLDFHKNERSIRTASVTQVRQPIYTSSVERWRNYESFLGPLLEALGEFRPE